MVRWFLSRQIDAFERQYEYDMGYARDILAADPRALLAFSKVQALSAYRKDVPRDVYAAVSITGTASADCGPCTQLVVTMALRDGVPARAIANVLEERDAELSDDMRLGVVFARASLAHSAEADAPRAQIVARFGERALVSLAFALTLSQVYPTLKYALGHGKACQRVRVAGADVAVLRGAA